MAPGMAPPYWLIFVDELLRHGGRAVQHDREAGQAAGDLLQHVEAQLGLRAGLELIRAVAGADGDGQRVAAGAADELLDLLGVGVGRNPRRRRSPRPRCRRAYPARPRRRRRGHGHTPQPCAVISMFSSKGLEDASIMTEVKPSVDAGLAQSQSCRRGRGAGTMGRPVSMTAASTSFIR